MAKKQVSNLTRPQRRNLYTGIMLVAWLALALWMLGVHRHRWIASPGNPILGNETREFGFPVFLTIFTRNVPIGGTNALPSSTATWTWHPLNIVIIAAALLVWAFLCRLGYVWLVNRALAAGRVCDECGYDLTGVAHEKCPECGAQRTGGATSAAPPEQ